MPRFRTGELALVALFSAIVVFQLFIPPSIGLANNGDFSKLIGRFSLASSSLDTSEEYKYFTARWVYNRAFHWMSDDRSSELIPISGAAVINWWVSSQVFDIRILGAIHAVLWVGCFRGFSRAAAAAGGSVESNRWRAGAVHFYRRQLHRVLQFVLHRCSGLAISVVGAGALALLHERPALVDVSAVHRRCYSLRFKQGATCSAPDCSCALMAVIAGLLFSGRWQKAGALALAGLILAAAALSFVVMPEEEKGDDAYAGIFMILLDKSPTPFEDLRDLGLGPEYAPLLAIGPCPLWPIPQTARGGTISIVEPGTDRSLVLCCCIPGEEPKSFTGHFINMLTCAGPTWAITSGSTVSRQVRKRNPLDGGA